MSTSRLHALVLCLLVGSISGTAFAGQPLVLREGIERYPLGRHLDFLEDREGKWKIGDVTSPDLSGRFKRSTSEAPGFGFETSPYWFRLDIRSEMQTGQRFLLKVGYPMLDRIEIYFQRGDGTFSRKVAGDSLPYGGKSIQHCDFLFPLQIDPGQHLRAIFRVQTQGSLQFPVSLWTPQGFRDHEHWTRISFGIYYGLLIVMILYNLLLFITTRDRSYLYFGLFSCSALAFLSSNDGMAQAYFWPAFPWWANRVVPFSLWACSLFGLLTTMDFLELKASFPRWHRLMSWLANVALFGALCSFVLPYNAIIRLSVLLAAPTMILSWIAGILAWRREYQPARFYVFAVTTLMLGVLLLVLSRLGIIPRSSLTESAHVIGFAINISFMSFALTDRINLMRRDKDRARAEALRIQQSAAATLEQEVATKTQDLRSKTEELAEAYTRLAEHDRLKSNFFANVSHELRTPLTLILTPLERLMRGEMGKLTETAEDRLRSMAGNTQRLLRLVNQLLEFSRLESGGTRISFVAVDVLAVVESITRAFEPFARSKGIQLELRAPDRLPPLTSDPAILEKVISNLLSNACKFTDPGGKVVVRIAASEAEIGISVKDTGIGIPEEDLPRIFERFHQVDSGSSRRYEGTGIGLALSKELVGLVGGRLEVESEVGLFSTFTVSLPWGQEHIPDPVLAHRPDPRQEEASPAVAEVSALEAEVGVGDRRSVEPAVMVDVSALPLLIVVEDNPDMRALVGEICADDFRVLEAADGRQGLEMIRQHRPALVVSDMMMPGMDGQELLRRIRSDAEIATIPVILLTAKVGEEMRLEGLESGADDYLVKPFEPRELRARAINLVRLQQQERELRRLNADLHQQAMSQAAQLERARALSTFLPPELVQEVIDGEMPLEQLQRRKLTIFQLELRGFDEVMESVDSEDLTVILNGYLSEMIDVAFAHGATVDAFNLDRVVGFFGAPRSEGLEQDARRCARMALEMWQRAREVCGRWQDLLPISPPLPTMVLVSGYATVGLFGSSERLSYTALGGAAQEVIELLDQIMPGEVVCTQSTWNLVENEMKAQQCRGVTIGSRQRMVRVYRLAGISEEGGQSGAVDGQITAPPPPVPTDQSDIQGYFPLKAGVQVAGRYQILRGLGEGGMGTVYQAWDLKLGADVALKVVRHANLEASQRYLKRLYWEVKLARLINHPNVARIFDIGEWEGQEFICMECIKGQTLAQRMTTDGALPPVEGMRILLELCDGLAAAHTAQIVHGDLKPSNIMLDEGGRVIILDFGIARWMALLRQQETATETKVFGTPYYMAPEQFRGEEVDARADIYSLGLVAYEMFTGSKPFAADNVVALAYQHVRVPPPSPLELCPDMHPRLVAVILRCLEKSPDRRFGTIGEIGPLLKSVES